MTDGVRSGDLRILRAMSMVLVAGAGIRLLASVVAGFVDWHDSGSVFPAARVRVFDVLSTFGAAGDGSGVLLALAAAATVWWLSWRDDAAATSLRASLMWIFGVTAALALADGVGFGFFYSYESEHQTPRLIHTEGFALAYIVVTVGALLLLRQLGDAIAAQDSDDLDAFIFAVDRKGGDVRAFLSAGEAKRRMHVYSVEDDEFAFYTDEGSVLEATVVDDRIVLRSTDQQGLAELVESLKEFANRRGITIDDEDADDPTAYAVPIGRWHWLEMWPPWMRPIGMLFRSRR